MIKMMTGTGIGERTQKFIHGAAWTTAGAFLAKGLSGGATLWAARCMGPANFGEASLAFAAGLWIQVPMMVGIPTALMHYLPPVKSDEKPYWSGLGFGLFTICSLSTLLIAILTEDSVRGWLGVPPHVYKWTLYWCVGYTLYTLSSSWVSAEEQFSLRAGMEIAFAAVFLAIVVLNRVLEQLNASNYMKAYCIAYVLVGISILVYRRHRLRFSLNHPENRHIFKRLISYGGIVTVGGLGSALLLAPGRLIATHFLDSVEVGYLAVYQGGSIQIASILSAIGAQVFFPIASRTPDKTLLRKKLNQVILYTALPSIAIVIALQAVYFLLLGKQYPFRILDATVYSVSAYFSFIFGIVSWYYSSLGRRGLLLQTLIGLLAGGINFAACVVLIPRFHIVGAGWAYALGTASGMVILFLPITQRWSGAEP